MLNKSFTDIVTLNLTKAVDTSCHKKLLLKLENHGIRRSALILTTLNLLNYLQYVSFNRTEQFLFRCQKTQVRLTLFFLLFAIVATDSCEGTYGLQVKQQPKFKFYIFIYGKIGHSLQSEYHVEKKKTRNSMIN